MVQTAEAAGSYYVCTQGSEGVGSAGVQVRLVVSLQKADVIVTLCLREEEWHKKCNWVRKSAKQSGKSSHHTDAMFPSVST